MDARVADNPEARRYEAVVDGDVAGFVTYRLEPGQIALLHTQVDDAFEGRGIGSTLVSKTLDDARARGREVLPCCPFVRSYIGKHPEYVDLVPESERGRFGL